MRVITGKYKGRHFNVPHNFKARPTTDFAKENLFNVLNGYLDFDEAPEALDLFAGTGSITLELLSRGCRRVVAVERDPMHFGFITKTLAALGDKACVPLRADVFRYLSIRPTPPGRTSHLGARPRTAEAGRVVRVGTRQNQRFLHPPAIHRAPLLWKRELLFFQGAEITTRKMQSKNAGNPAN